MTFPVVGMVGGGQLSRMTHQASIPLGLRFRVLADGHHDAAAQVARDVMVGDHRNLDDLLAFADGCDVMTFDHEHVPAEHLRVLEAEGQVIRPSSAALVHAQDKSVMRRRMEEIGVRIPRWRLVATAEDIVEFADVTGWPVVIKTVRGGYDGKGVWTAATEQEARALVEELAGRHDVSLMVEERVEFQRELAILVARSPHGQAAVYPVVETVQVDGICREVIAPAQGISEERAVQAQEIALQIAGALDVTGMMAVEVFDTQDGVCVNELAMRPHNSGHWTIDGARTSQFEQHLRAILDLPLGAPVMTTPYAVMVNVLGGHVPDMYSGYPHCMARDPSLRIHMYGKDVRSGRKVGHVTAVGDDLGDVRERARHAAAYLRGDIDG